MKEALLLIWALLFGVSGFGEMKGELGEKKDEYLLNSKFHHSAALAGPKGPTIFMAA